MKYDEIIASAIGYSDRTDLADKMDLFVTIVESRISRLLKVQKMSARSVITTNLNTEYYALPADFAGMRDIQISEQGESVYTTLEMATPEQMNLFSQKPSFENTNIHYSIIANQIQILPKQDNKILEIVYYRRIPELNEVEDENWVSVYHPDLYIFGLLTEINAYIKDAQMSSLWDGRFNDTIGRIVYDDDNARWSGTPYKIRNEI